MVMNRQEYGSEIQRILDEAVAHSRRNCEGRVANYIPELANVNSDLTSAAIRLTNGDLISSGDWSQHIFTLQSVAKLVPLIGLVEEYGRSEVFSWIDAEPSGGSFASISQLEKYGPVPSNPMVNAGAIALCGRIPGDTEQRAKWLDDWVERLFGQPLTVNQKVFSSETATGDRNRSLAYYLKSTKVLNLPVEEVLATYFYLCSYEANVIIASHLAALLANGGLNAAGERVFSETTSNCVVAIMATCGLYDESGMSLVITGLPAKSGVSGVMLAVATGRGGIAVASPRINPKGGSIRGHAILAEVSSRLEWHFAAPWGYLKS